MDRYCKRLIEVDLPIKRISAHSRREKSIRHGHISTLHIWWARRPLAACRAVICASLWPDPADDLCPDAFRNTARDQITKWAKNHLQLLSEDSYPRFIAISKDEHRLDDLVEMRAALLDFIADFANWDNANNKEYLATSRTLTEAAHRSLSDSPLVDPLLFDPFAGGGAIPLEGSRIGAQTFASDLNPIPILLNRAALEYIPLFGSKLADAVLSVGKQIEREALAELEDLYPLDPDGSKPIAWLWARTVRCEGPSCRLEYPLVGQTWVLRSRNKSQEVLLGIRDGRVITEVVDGSGETKGTRTARGASAVCPRPECQFVMKASTIQKQLSEKDGGASSAQLLAVVCRTKDGKRKFARTPDDHDSYLSKNVTERQAEIESERIKALFPAWDSRAFTPGLYGISEWGHMHTPRQTLALATFARHVREVEEQVSDSRPPFRKAVRTFLGFVLGRSVDTMASTCRWVPGTVDRAGAFIAAANGGEKQLRWLTDFAEANPFSGETGSWSNHLGWVVRVIENLTTAKLKPGQVVRASAMIAPLPNDSADVLFTDPPYGSAVPYSDLSDFFYVWLRRCIGDLYPELFQEELTPKREEAVVNLRKPADDRGDKTEETYHEAMTMAFQRSREILKPNGISLVVFADKRTSEWESILRAILESGWIITASWPIDTERPGRQRALGSAALASSIYLVCRPREDSDGVLRMDIIGDWRNVLAELPQRIHKWMSRLAEEGVVGADAIFACLGPALEIYSSYASVEKASGEKVELKEYLEQVWAAVSREALNMIFEGADATGFEEDARLTAMWLWTLRTTVNGNAEVADDDATTRNRRGYNLEYDAARKIAQGLGAHLENLDHLVEIKGDTATLFSAAARTRYLFGKSPAEVPSGRKRKKKSQLTLKFEQELEELEKESGDWAGELSGGAGSSILDQLHQSMVLFAAGRGEALKRFLVEDGVGRDPRFWRLAQALSALYPSATEEKRWVDGVLARKKGLGL